MNPFYIIWMVFFASYCSSQIKHDLNTDSEKVTRYDTYSYAWTSELKYIWAIHNISDHLKLGTSKILSPQFSAPKTDPEWYIKITPRGTDKKNETIAVDVYLCDYISIKEASAKYAISIINNDKKRLWFRNSTNFTKFQAGRSHGWPEFCKTNDLFRNQLLQNDTLMLLIHITVFSGSSHTENTQEPDENLLRCDTYLQKQIQEVEYIWAIHNFTHHEISGTREISSSIFEPPTIDRRNWRIIIYPNDIEDGKETISLEVTLWSSLREIVGIESAEVNISAINDKKEAIISASTKFEEPGGYCSKKWSRFCTKDDFFRNQILQNDTLTLSASSKRTFPHTHVISYPHKASSPRPTPQTTLLETTATTENFESMLENPKLADVVFAINGSNYPAHRAILAARSPVFATMFQRKHMKNGKLKQIRVKVTNMNEQVLRAMLRYIYTGKCENLSDLADELLVAAVKYGLNGLRKICEKERSKTLVG
ncbi:speckle-type POZ protein-like [Planococcus citri]|uniref:speckle-type POZ protein-like n=1 Tax=Planococcus citri TaxID=170843 RepID=UPI0031F81087